jgi:acyl-CoA synthetase (AMP-forming)/AMP-acid ligase II
MQEVALGRRPNLDAFIGSIQMAIMQGHGLSAGAILAVRPGTIPLTSSGKIRRSACRDLYWSRQPAPLALWQNTSLQSGSGAGS